MKRRTNVFMVFILLSILFMSSTAFTQAKALTNNDIDDNAYVIEPQKTDDELIKEYYSVNSLSNGITKLGNLDVDFGNAYRSTRRGSTMFVAGLTGGVTFIDVSNVSEPVILGNYLNISSVYDAIYHKGYCITGHSDGLDVLTYSDYDRIRRSGGYYDNIEILDVEGYGLDIIYTARGTEGLGIFTTRNGPTTPEYIGAKTYGVSNIVNVRADGQNELAFLSAGSDGVVVLDISTPLNPVVKTILKDGPTNAKSVDFSAKILYIADGAFGAKAYNYTDNENITLIDQFEIGPGETAEFFDMDVNYKAFLSTGQNGYLYMLNMTDVTNITERWKLDFPVGNPFGITVYQKTIYLSNEFDYRIINLTTEDAPQDYSHVVFAGEPLATAIRADGKIGVLAEGITGFDIINTTDPSDPVFLSKYEEEGVSFIDAAIVGNYTFAATSIGIEIMNITDPTEVVSLSSLLVGATNAIAIEGNYAYLAVQTRGLVVVDITDLTNPIEVSDFALLSTNPLDVDVQGTDVFVAVGSQGFQVFDLSTPAAPVSLDNISTTNARGVRVNDTVLVVADYDAGVRIYDITNLLTITELDHLVLSGLAEAVKVEVYEDLIFVAASGAGVILVDAANVLALVEDSYFYDGGESLDVSVAEFNGEPIVFAADAIDSFEVLGRDTDLDRIADYEEPLWGTDPLLVDTDFDQLNDGDEVDYWLDRGEDPLDDWELDGLVNLLDQDSDNDTIIDGIEVNFWGSDPIDLDSDDDTVSDEDEVNTYLTHPANADTDADLIDDGDEIYGYYLPTNPAANVTGYIPGQNNGGLNVTNPDTDYDTPTDGWETFWGYNPLVADSDLDDDLDGLNNTMEFLYGCEPDNDDTDGDGILDGEEVIPGVDGFITNPTDEDTDGDFLPDLWEVEEGFDPTDEDIDDNGVLDSEEDSDGDGLTNYQEWFFDIDPHSGDTDGDTMDDYWEVTYGTDAANPLDAYYDPDNDGLTNLEEYNSIYDIDPFDPDTDDDGYLDSVEIEGGFDPTDRNDHPTTTPYTNPGGIALGITLSILALAGLSIYVVKRRKH
ncbi:MAG: hypothetical protein ACTSVH_00125 [Candidatus Heimdallarchaeota archaeon]